MHWKLSQRKYLPREFIPRATAFRRSVVKPVRIGAAEGADLPREFLGAERQWYRGLAYLEDQVIPVVSPLGFLTSQEFQRLDGATAEASRRDLERAAQI